MSISPSGPPRPEVEPPSGCSDLTVRAASPTPSATCPGSGSARPLPRPPLRLRPLRVRLLRARPDSVAPCARDASGAAPTAPAGPVAAPVGSATGMPLPSADAASEASTALLPVPLPPAGIPISVAGATTAETASRSCLRPPDRRQPVLPVAGSTIPTASVRVPIASPACAVPPPITPPEPPEWALRPLQPAWPPLPTRPPEQPAWPPLPTNRPAQVLNALQDLAVIHLRLSRLRCRT
jgi:hypothetical protein